MKRTAVTALGLMISFGAFLSAGAGCGSGSGSAGAEDDLPVSQASLADVVRPSSNMALGRPTSQWSMNHLGVSSRAVDGNTSGWWGDGSVTHTAYESQAWWQVDLEAVRSVGDVVLYNRTDCCTDRL